MRSAIAALCFVPGLLAQSAQLTAAEVEGAQAMLAWQQSAVVGSTRVDDLGTARGYRARAIVDVDGRDSAVNHRTRAGRTHAFVLWPYNDDRNRLQPRRLLFGTPDGRVLAGVQPLAAQADWQPAVETIAAPGVRAHVNNMLCTTGSSQDDTHWLRLQLDAGAQTVIVTDDAGKPLADAQVSIGAAPFGWHPGWLRLDDGTARAMHGLTDATGTLSADAIAATGLCLSVKQDVRQAVLQPADVRQQDGALRIVVGAKAWRSAKALDQQAEAAVALRLGFHYQMQLHHDATLDQDRDGRGEFGLAFDLLPMQRRNQVLVAGDRRVLIGAYLFEVFLPGRDGHLASGLAADAAVDADGAEQHFAILAWPARAGDGEARVFHVDERGIVTWSEAAGRCGHRQAPAPGCAFASDSTGAFGAALAIDARGRDGQVWHRLLP